MFKFFLICLFVNIFNVGELKNDSKLNTIGKNCHRCKILTESYNYWLDRTSRGKFEGGDAAWEEAKLKTYARSEVRLVEIQEGLCSELKKGQDQCYALNEEVEPIVETWWTLENSTSIDLLTWLCIDKLKYCCPKNYFGENCQICPTINNKICNGHGKCYGDGTRHGNGSCICFNGYKGHNCEECSANFFNFDNDRCEPCHKACNGCHKNGSSACTDCAVGWIMESDECIDINECDSSVSCKSNQFCINNEGAYTCKPCDKSCNTCLGRGSFNCTSCDSDEVLLAGQCFTGELLKQTLRSVILRLFLYLVLIIVNIAILKNSKSIATLFMLGVSVVIFYSEQNFQINITHIVLNYSDVFNIYVN